MTTTLRSMLDDHARTVEMPTPDLQELVRRGERGLRRRRAVRVVAGAASALALVTGAVVATMTGPEPDGAVDPTDGAARVADPAHAVDTDVVIWSRGSVLHTPDSTRDVGVQVAAFVRTSVGYVVADRSGGVYAVDADSVERVGTATVDTEDGLPWMVADPAGPLVAWVDPSGPRPTVVVLDQARGTEARDSEGATAAGSGSRTVPTVRALDGDVLYLGGSKRTLAVDLGDGSTASVPADPASRAGSADLIGAGGGRVALASDEPYGVFVGAAADPTLLLPDTDGQRAALSRDGRYVTIDADQPQVRDTGSGREVELDLDRAFATGYDWLADGRLVVLTSRPDRDDQVEFVTCVPDTGACVTVADGVGSFEELLADGAYPTGTPLE